MMRRTARDGARQRVRPRGRLLLWGLTAALAAAMTVAVNGLASGDQVDLLNGRTLSGDLLEETDDGIVFHVRTPVGNAKMRLSWGEVHAVATGDGRRVINEMPGGTTPALPAGGAPEGDAPRPGNTRTPREVLALIEQAGTTKPDWWDATPLTYPGTLDLTWRKVREDWAPEYNLGAYMYTFIVERPQNWRQGVKLLHHVREVNANDPAALRQTLEALAEKYRTLLQDHARSAYWNLQGGACDPVGLAECYWKLGNTDMAVDVLRRIGADRTRNCTAVKLWAEVGDLGTALQVAEDAAWASPAGPAYLAAGDACRYHGQYEQAIKYYDNAIRTTRNDQRQSQIGVRAQASIAALRGFAGVDLARIPDGTYPGQGGGGFKGPVDVEVTVANGKLTEVKVVQYKENWFLASLDYVPKKIVEEQGIAGVDAVTGATTTSRAILNATANALKSAAP